MSDFDLCPNCKGAIGVFKCPFCEINIRAREKMLSHYRVRDVKRVAESVSVEENAYVRRLLDDDEEVLYNSKVHSIVGRLLTLHEEVRVLVRSS